MIKTQNIRKTGLLCLALSYFGRVSGRTRLKKILYFANITGWNAIRDYVFYDYGPYSDWLKREIQTLTQNGIIEEKKEDSMLEDKVIYHYQLSETGKSFANYIISQVGEPELLESTKKLFNILSNYSTDDLEIMSSLVFLKISDPDKDEETLVKLVKLCKPKFDVERIRKELEIFNVLKPFLQTP